MRSHLTLLLCSAGRRVALLQCFRDAAERLGIALRVVGVDAKPELSSACQAADIRYAVPRCTDQNFIPSLLNICRQEGVALIVPTIDTELPALAEASKVFGNVGTRVIVSSLHVVSIARDKLQTARLFSNAQVPVPRTVRLKELLSEPLGWQWPIVLKPVGGSSSVGLQIAHTIDEARRTGTTRDDYIAQELLVGREYTVNVFFDKNGQLKCVIPHWRIETRSGEVSKGRTERVPVLVEIAQKIAGALPGARGALCFQAILTSDGRVGVFELNARFGGGYPLAHRAGARFAQWILEEEAGLPPTAHDDWDEGITMLRYDAAVFING